VSPTAAAGQRYLVDSRDPADSGGAGAGGRGPRPLRHDSDRAVTVTVTAKVLQCTPTRGPCRQCCPASANAVSSHGPVSEHGHGRCSPRRRRGAHCAGSGRGRQPPSQPAAAAADSACCCRAVTRTSGTEPGLTVSLSHRDSDSLAPDAGDPSESSAGVTVTQ
jgi:hypothetical protein